MYERMQKTTLVIEDMHGAGGVAAVASVLRRLPTVHVERAAAGAVTVVHDPAGTSRGALVAAVEGAGYHLGVA